MQELATMRPVGSPAVRVLVMVPTYNEAENIDEVLRRVRRAVPDADILVIDDASPDGTSELAEKLRDEIGHIDVLRRPGEVGPRLRVPRRVPPGPRRRLRRHGRDGRRSLDTIPTRCRRSSSRSSTAPTSRSARGYVRGGSIPDWKLGRRTISRVGCLYARIMLGLSVNDATAGYRAYHRRLLSQIDLERVRADGYGFQVEMTYLSQRAGAHIVEVPIEFRDRTLGRSKMSSRIVVEALLLVTRWGIRDRIARVRRSYEDLRARH